MVLSSEKNKIQNHSIRIVTVFFEHLIKVQILQNNMSHAIPDIHKCSYCPVAATGER
jgi:hypothetical protein